ncbi:MAG TPA: hypothetical protein VF526_06670 [Solirubrobacteraceae bacterium]
MPTAANHFLAVRHPPDADRLAEQVVRRLPANVMFDRLDGEPGALGIPRWTTLVFSMNDAHHRDVVHIVDRLLGHTNLGDAFAAPELV